MTNLFTRLAARTLELTPIVQPRIDSVFTPEIAAEAIEPAAQFTQSAKFNPAAQPCENDIGVHSPLVNPYQPTLPIAHAPRSVAAAIVQTLASQPDVSSVQGNQTVPNLSSAIERTVVETNSVAPAREVVSPIEALNQSYPVPTNSPAETPPFAPRVITTENTVPQAIVSPAMSPKELQARSDSEPSRLTERLPPLTPNPTLAISADFSVAEAELVKNSAPTDSHPEQILGSREVLRTNQVVTQSVIYPVQPQPDRAKVSPAVTVAPVVMPRQTDVLLPTVAPRMDRSVSRQPQEKSVTPSPPTIQVTIGRIEVRAESPSTPPRPRAVTPKARLSLEDYLRSRSGGEQ